MGLINPGWHTRVIAKKRITHAAWLAPDAGRFLLNSLKAAIKPQNNAIPKATPAWSDNVREYKAPKCDGFSMLIAVPQRRDHKRFY